MHLRRKNNFTFLLFFLVLFSVPVFWMIRGENPQQFSIIESRKLDSFSLSNRLLFSSLERFIRGEPEMAKAVINEQFIQRSFQQDAEKAASDQFPLRIQAIQLSKAIDRLVITLAYTFLDDPAIPADMQNEYYILRDESQIIYSPGIFGQSEKQVVDQRIANYASLISTYPDINFYAYYLERLRYSTYHPLNKYYSDADRGQSLIYFEDNKPNDLALGKLMLSSYEDYATYFYKTDNHLNIHGILRAYYGIYALLAQNYPEISLPVEIESIYTFPDIGFQGTLARITMYPIQPEVFEVARYNIAPHKIFDYGKETIYNNSAQYLAGNYSTEPYINHYGDYFGSIKSNLRYEFENESNRNLLLIGDSFSIPYLPLVASHYKNTHVVDPRWFDAYSSADFLLKNEIDDVIIVGDNTVLFTEIDWLIVP